jgi:TonB family protein
MTQTDHLPDKVEACAHGNRAHMRRKLSPMAYVELGQDNGGILLNLGEGGFAVQSALALTSDEFRELRFQVPAVQRWLTAGGRIVWMSDSKKEAGIQFTELPGDARREIQRWVLADGEPEKTAERVPVSSMENSPKRILDAPYREGGGSLGTASHGAHAKGIGEERDGGPVRHPQTAGVAVAEPAAQDFHFTEYSMFAADPEKAGVWAEAPRHPGSWRWAGLGILVAVLFFALGVTVGRETLERWIADLGVWTQNQPTPGPKVTPPAPPEQTGEAAGKDDKGESKSAENQDAIAEDRVNPSPGPTGNSEAGKGASQKANDAEPRTNDTEVAKPGPVPDSGRAAGPSRGAIVSGHAPERRQSAETGIPRDSGEEVAPSRIAAEHSILVNAPEPGSPPFVVNLPGEAVSASGAIAVSARRTLEILPRSSGSFGRSERVVIGKLISHSEPFYPVEARNRRLEGNVELRARVGRTGEIVSVTPVSGPRLLSSAAMTAVREWRYEPTFVDGDPAETFADITIVFRLP